MLLISPEYLGIPLAQTIPPHLIQYEVPGSLPLYGQTPKCEYLFQNLKCKPFRASFINFFSLDEHDFEVLKKAPSFFIVVQLVNTLEVEFYKLRTTRHHEWSVNLFYGKNIHSKITLQRSKDYSTFILFIPTELVKRLCKNYPTVKRFYESQQSGKHLTEKLNEHPICNFKTMDLISSLQTGQSNNFRTYVKLSHAIFELLSKKKLQKQCYVEKGMVEKIYALKKFMVEHLTENLTRKELSEKFDLSLYHFEKTFFKIYNATPFLLLRYYRMSAVKRELQQCKHGLKECEAQQSKPVLKELAAKYHYTYNAFLRAYRSIFRTNPVGLGKH